MLRFSACVPLLRHCTFSVGGAAKRLAFADSLDQLVEAEAMGALILGRGSNVLIGDHGYDGDVVLNRTDGFVFSEDTCTCDSGVSMTVLSRAYADEGREGLSWAYGLPGSVGGAVVGNAGAFGGCIADAVRYVTVCRGGEVRRLSRDECGFGYRKSDIGGAVLSLTLDAKSGDREKIRESCRSSLYERKRRQPSGASAGSVFKSAEFEGKTVSAGYLIERAGLKGLKAGGAEISAKHANFIINRGGASAADVLQLINTARAEVFDRFGVRLEREIKFFGEFL